MTLISRRAIFGALLVNAVGTRVGSAQARVLSKPKPLPAGAVTHDWTAFLGPTHNAVSTETRLSRTLPPPLVWEFPRGTGYASPAIAGDRLVFAPVWPHAEHLARHRSADLFLDTLPYGAHTGASDALGAGLPVLTCLGESFAGRVAASLLHAVGLSDMVTQSLEEYEARALQLARDPALLDEVTERLARNRETHALFDTARFTRHLESAYGQMVERHRAGERPQSFAVDLIEGFSP